MRHFLEIPDILEQRRVARTCCLDVVVVDDRRAELRGSFPI
jgi:hypothetical protein